MHMHRVRKKCAVASSAVLLCDTIFRLWVYSAISSAFFLSSLYQYFFLIASYRCFSAISVFLSAPIAYSASSIVAKLSQLNRSERFTGTGTTPNVSYTPLLT